MNMFLRTMVIMLRVRAGAWRTFADNGWYPVAASETMTFRRSLRPWQRYALESRVVGAEDVALPSVRTSHESDWS